MKRVTRDDVIKAIGAAANAGGCGSCGPCKGCATGQAKDDAAAQA